MPASPNSRPTRTFVSIDNITALALGGVLRLGIVDATVWGFHRFVNEQLRLLYDAKLPTSVNPFVLGDMVVRQSGRRIRPMRRRRLRWEKDGSMIARGKRGWVGFVVQQAGVPIVLDELGGMLSLFYQDYDSYVVDQLNLDAEEEGESDFGVTMLPGIPHKLSPILMPNDWELDAKIDNTSDGVKLSVARAIILLREKRLALSDLEHIPWFVELLQRHCYGTDFQSPPKVSSRSKKPESQGTFFSLDATEIDMTDAVPAKSRSAPQQPHMIEDLLQRFL